MCETPGGYFHVDGTHGQDDGSKTLQYFHSRKKAHEDGLGGSIVGTNVVYSPRDSDHPGYQT